MATTTPDLKERLNVPSVSSSYPTLGATYKQAGYPIEYSSRLIRTGKDYYDSKAQIPEGQRMSTAAEELAIQLGLERSGADPRKASAFDDLFARNEPKTYVWQWTETFLRVPSGKSNPGKPDYIDPQGRKYWTREFGNGSEVAGIVYVPEGNNRAVPKTQDLLDVWDPITGLPRVTSDSDNDTKHGNHTTHFWFNPNPDKDSKSGHYDVAAGRWCDWLRDELGGCLAVVAGYRRLAAGSRGGFRPVRGLASGVEKELALINH